jgi:hypothetical protein
MSGYPLGVRLCHSSTTQEIYRHTIPAAAPVAVGAGAEPGASQPLGAERGGKNTSFPYRIAGTGCHYSELLATPVHPTGVLFVRCVCACVALVCVDTSVIYTHLVMGVCG